MHIGIPPTGVQGRVGAVGRLLGWLIRSRPSRTFGVVGLRGVRATIPLATLFVGKRILDGLSVLLVAPGAGPAEWYTLLPWVGCECLLMVSIELLGRLSTFWEARLGEAFAADASIAIMRQASTLSLAQLEDPATANMLARAGAAVASQTRLIGTLSGIAQSSLTTVTMTMSVGVLMPGLVPLLFAGALPLIWAEARASREAYRRAHEWTPDRRRLDYYRHLAASEGTAAETRLFDLSKYLIDRYRKLADRLMRDNARAEARHVTAGGLVTLIGNGVFYAGYAWILYRILGLPAGGVPKPTVGLFAFLAGAYKQSRDLLQQSLLSGASVFDQTQYLMDLFAFLDLRASIPADKTASPPPLIWRVGIEFVDVGFRYPNADHWTLRHISFRIPPQGRIALVGENGAGKSTIVKLLTRLYEPTEGRILLDGKDIREYGLDDLRAQMSVLVQTFTRYEMSLGENIGIGRVESIEDLSAITEAARKGSADTLAARFTEGYAQVLGRQFTTGAGLSGGEWQRVALARGYIRQANLFVFDEPTAPLDARAEFQAVQRFAAATEGRAALVISHRFATVRLADSIIVLRAGEILEQGDHATLVQADGMYAELFALQAAGYR